MSDADRGLVPFENLGTEKSDLLLEYPSSCFVGVVYYTTEGRNAWHNRWRNKYIDQSAFALTRGEAESTVEKWRVQGSTWMIRHLPCAVFTTDRYALCLAEINTQNPLLRYDLSKAGSLFKSFHQLCLMFSPLARNSTIRLITQRKDIQRYAEPQMAWASMSKGGRVELQWIKLNKIPVAQDVTHITKIADTCDLEVKSWRDWLSS